MEISTRLDRAARLGSPPPEKSALSRLGGGIRRLSRNPLSAIGMVITLFMVAVAVVAPFLAPYDPLEQNILERVADPSPAHWFGSDEFGRDIYSRVLYGARASMSIASAVMFAALLIGTSLGLVAGYFAGLADTLIMRFLDLVMAFPGILLAIGIMAILGPGAVNVVLALTIVYTPVYARQVRGSVLSVKTREYVQSATATGASTPRIILRHILPNSFAPILVQATIVFVYAIRTEATLSFLGLGMPPPNPTWGNILRDSTGFLTDAPWMPFFPGLSIAFTIFGVNLFGDGLRDVLDPRLRK